MLESASRSVSNSAATWQRKSSTVAHTPHRCAALCYGSEGLPGLALLFLIRAAQKSQHRQRRAAAQIACRCSFSSESISRASCKRRSGGACGFESLGNKLGGPPGPVSEQSASLSMLAGSRGNQPIGQCVIAIPDGLAPADEMHWPAQKIQHEAKLGGSELLRVLFSLCWSLDWSQNEARASDQEESFGSPGQGSLNSLSVAATAAKFPYVTPSGFGPSMTSDSTPFGSPPAADFCRFTLFDKAGGGARRWNRQRTIGLELR